LVIFEGGVNNLPRQLLNAEITHVSYVDKAANKKKFFMLKQEENPHNLEEFGKALTGEPQSNFELNVKIVTKAEDEQKLVYGIVYEPDEIDAHGDYMTAEEIEKAAHNFIAKYRQIDRQHNFISGVGEVVESYIAPSDIEVGTETIKKGSWVLVTKASDEVWEAIQKGEITGYSMAGYAKTIEEEEEVKKEFTLFQKFKAFMKGEVKDKFNAQLRSQSFWTAFDALQTSLRKYNWETDAVEYEQDDTKIREALQDFNDIITKILLTPNVIKSIGKKEEIDMTPEQLQEAIAKALEPVQKELEELKKERASAEENQVDDTPAEEKEETTEVEKSELTAEKVAEIVKSAIAPLAADLEAVKKSRGLSSSEKIEKQEEAQKEETLVQKSSDGVDFSNIFGGLFR
jgi:hypothetical protein